MIIVAILGVITLYSTSTFLRNQILTQFRSVAERQSEALDELVSAREEFINTLANDSSLKTHLSEAFTLDSDSSTWTDIQDLVSQRYSQIEVQQPERYFSDFVVISSDNEIIISSDPRWEGASLDPKVYGSLLDEPGSLLLYNIYPFYAEGTNQLLLFTSQQIYDEADNFLGTIFGITTASTFERILEAGELSHPQANSYFITSPSSGEVYVGLSLITGELTAFSPTLDHIEMIMPNVVNQTPESTVEFSSFENIPVLGFIKWLSPVETALVLEVPQSVLIAPLQNAIIVLIVIFVIAMALLGIAIWSATRRIVRPIVNVSTAAQKFADGDFTARTDVERNDEIGLLAFSFNQVADQLVSTLETQESLVESRTQQVQVTAEVAQVITSASNIETMLSKVVNLIHEQFNYYHTAIYLLDRGGDYLILRDAAGQGAETFRDQGLRLAVGSRSIIGTVAATNKTRVAPDVKSDPYYMQFEALTDTQAEAAIPLSVGNSVLGVLDIHSTELQAFDDEDVATLQTMAQQIASSLQNMRLLESTQIDLQSANLLYQTSNRLADASTVEEVFQTLADTLRKNPYNSILFRLGTDALDVFEVISDTEPLKDKDQNLPITTDEIENIIKNATWKVIRLNDENTIIPKELLNVAKKTGCSAFVLIPLMAGERCLGLILLGSTDESQLTVAHLEPYQSISQMSNTALEKIEAVEAITTSYAELQSMNNISQAIATETELAKLFDVLNRQIEHSIGEVNFLVALYDTESQLIEIPYLDEGDEILSIPPFPLGQGLTSIVIRTQQPLMIVEDTLNRTRALGAIVTNDRQALSWLGVPMQVGGEVVGAIVIQDLEREHRFDEDDLRLVSALASQVASTVRTARLLASAQEAAERDRRLFEITDAIRQANSIQDILATTTQEISQALDLKKASIKISVKSRELDNRDNGARDNGTEEKSA
jgi:GAF domain-containing protein/HAMP domain-containing protein